MPSQAGAGPEEFQGKTWQGKEGGRTKITQICQVRRVLAQKNFNKNSYCCDFKQSTYCRPRSKNIQNSKQQG